MKKIMYLFAIMALTATFAACEKNGEISAEQSLVSKEQSETMKKLSLLNDSLLGSNSGTRGWGRRFLEFTTIASADICAFKPGATFGGWTGAKIGFAVGGFKGVLVGGITGAVVGGTLTSTGASYGAYRAFKCVYAVPINDIIPDFQEYGLVNELTDAAYNAYKDNFAVLAEDNTLIAGLRSSSEPLPIEDYWQPPIQDIVPIETGLIHNTLLEKMLFETNQKIDTNTLSIEDKETYFKIREDVKSQEALFETIYSNTISAYTTLKETNDVSLFLGKLKKSFSSDNNSFQNKVIDLFLNIYLQYPEDINDVFFIIDKYAEIIMDAQDLTDDDKKNILYSLSIAAYSSAYWEQQLENN